MQITKDRNFILVYGEDATKIYKFDIATFTWYGLAGQPLKTNPQVLRNDPNISFADGDKIAIRLLKTALENKSDCLKRQHARDCFALYERVLVLGITVDFNEINYNYGTFSEVRFDAAFIEYLRANYHGRLSNEAVSRYKYRALKAKYPDLDGERFNGILSVIEDTGNVEYGEYLCVQVLHKYLYQFSNWVQYAKKHYERLKLMNITDWKKDKSFLDAYCRVATEYDVWKNRAMSIKLAETRKPQLAYENDKYIVIVPTTEAEYKDEADMQDNCVYRMYMERVANGTTNIVFIRKKSDPTKSVITCEVSNNFRMEQYLAKRNTYASTTEENFKKEYIEYLCTLKS